MAAVAVPVAIAAVSMITSFMGAKKASKAAKRAAKKEAIAEGKVTTERIRQLGVEEELTRGETIAATAASGVKVNQDSPLMILANQAREFAHERRITQEVGASKASAALERGRNVATQYKYQSYSNLAQSASNIFSIMNNAGKFSSGQTNSTYGPPT